MQPSGNPLVTLALFCKVVDNYGDIGICWRLSRQLHDEHGIAVTLWVDDLYSFHRICPEVACDAALQQIAGVTVRHWLAEADELPLPAEDIADIVIEFFGCDVPVPYIAAMAAMSARRGQPVWLNLEGLSAEAWVEGCHRLPSPHPRLALTKYFFFPGFTQKTGGLLHEATLPAARERFQADRSGVVAFLTQLGVTPREARNLNVSLFCYPHAPVAALFSAWQTGDEAITCLVPEGVAVAAIAAFLDAPAVAGAARTRSALTVRVIPFMAQPDYDRLLWACDLNFVRGEDSFVRAQWAGKPFLWHIYPQDKNLHHVKLRAFLRRHAEGIDRSGDSDDDSPGDSHDDSHGDSLTAATMRWNDAALPGQEPTPAWAMLWQRLRSDLPALGEATARWERQMLENGNLASNLMEFATTLRQIAAQKPD